MIRVYQCKERCCLASPQHRRFWMAELPCGTVPFTSWRAAMDQAAYTAARLPQEVTA